MNQPDTIRCELAVIGAGMAGMAATLFAAERGISTVQCGSAGGLTFAGGMLDLLGRDPEDHSRFLSNPWKGIRALGRSEPEHPYRLMGRGIIEESLRLFTAFLSSCGLPYVSEPESNSKTPTAMGTVKPTYFVPRNMWDGVVAMRERKSCLLVGFRGMKEFSAVQMAANLSGQWQGLRAVGIEFPGAENTSELYPEQLARSLEVPGNRAALAKRIRQSLKAEAAVGLPAILGIHRVSEIREEISKMIGVPVFEIPTPLVSVYGLRIREAFEQQLPQKGVRCFFGSKVHRVEAQPGSRFKLQINQGKQMRFIDAESVVLAGGRFLGGGLKSDRKRIRESLFNLPVVQPDSRMDWHASCFLGRDSHPVNRSGLAVNSHFQPLDGKGQPVFKGLFAAGSILANQDWIREQSGSGISISTAYAAVQSFLKLKNPSKS